MRMYPRIFNTLHELEEFVNATGIPQDRIVEAGPEGKGTFLLIYYGE